MCCSPPGSSQPIATPATARTSYLPRQPLDLCLSDRAFTPAPGGSSLRGAGAASSLIEKALKAGASTKVTMEAMAIGAAVVAALVLASCAFWAGLGARRPDRSGHPLARRPAGVRAHRPQEAAAARHGPLLRRRHRRARVPAAQVGPAGRRDLHLEPAQPVHQHRGGRCCICCERAPSGRLSP
jgi:hypothetical protein